LPWAVVHGVSCVAMGCGAWSYLRCHGLWCMELVALPRAVVRGVIYVAMGCGAWSYLRCHGLWCMELHFHVVSVSIPVHMNVEVFIWSSMCYVHIKRIKKERQQN
jgi:hypothetical protein